MKFHNSFLQTLFLLVLAASTQAQITTLYENPFIVSGGTGGGTSVGLTNTVPSWSGYTGATATLVTSTSSRIFMGDRAFKDAPADTYGIVAMDGNGGNPKFALTTTGVNINTTAPDLTFNWLQGNGGDGSAPLRIAILIGSQWYASATTFTTPGQSVASFASTTSTTAVNQSLVFSETASNWNLINFTAGSVLSLGSTASSDLSGTITGLGFFSDASFNTNNVRFADFTVTTTAVPEPSTTAAAAVGLLGTLAFLRAGRRRRNA